MKRIISLLVVMTVWSGALLAQDREAAIQPGVARVSLIHGEISTQRGDSGDQTAASLNAPIVAGDEIAAGPNSRAEVQLDYANLVRLNQNAITKIAELSSSNIHLQVGQGEVNYNVLKGNETQSEIDTPNLVVRPLEEGSYRIRVNSPAQTQVIVRKGSAEIVTPQGSTRLEDGQLITVEGTDNPQYQTVSAPKKDDWDDWNKDRDNLISNAESRRRTGQYYTGSQDLDAYGHWQDDPDYGSVWVPAVAAGWAPYRSGRWSWAPYYGWTWVSYEPWGWAPYHYGRWLNRGGSWCWWPGPVAVYPAYRPVWAPAYVSFFGFGGGGVHVGVSFGNIGWAPIGPIDHYYPWYGSRVNRINYINVNNIKNVTHVTNVNNIYNYEGRVVPPLHAGRHGRGHSNIHGVVNDPHVRQGITRMAANDFGKTSVPRYQPNLDSGTVRKGHLLTGGVPVVPTRESLKPVNRSIPSNGITANPGNYRRYFSLRPAAPGPKPFAEEADTIQKRINASKIDLSAGKEKNPLLASINKPNGQRPQFKSFEPKIKFEPKTKINLPNQIKPTISPAKTLNPIQQKQLAHNWKTFQKPNTTLPKKSLSEGGRPGAISPTLNRPQTFKTPNVKNLPKISTSQKNEFRTTTPSSRRPETKLQPLQTPQRLPQKSPTFQSFSRSNESRPKPSISPQRIEPREQRSQTFRAPQNVTPRTQTFRSLPRADSGSQVRPAPQRVESRPQNFSAPQRSEPRAPKISTPQNNSRSYERPPLNLRQPIVTPRTPSSMGGRQLNRNFSERSRLR